MNVPSVTEKKSSAQELRTLLEGLHPRRPEEVMGEAATSNLASSTITASIVGVLSMLALTLVMFVISPIPKEKSPASSPESRPEDRSEPLSGVPLPDAAPESTATAVQNTATETAIEAMGIGDATDPESSTEPLQSRIDELLDGLE